MATSPSDTYTLRGQIISLKGHPLQRLTIRAYDKDPVSPDDPLGVAVTDTKGLYTIQFNKKVFQIERTGPDVYIRVYSGETLLGASKILRNAETKVTIDLTIDTDKIKPDPDEKLDAAQLKKLSILSNAIVDTKIKQSIADAFRAAKGDWVLAKEALKKAGTDETLIRKLEFTHSLAEATKYKEDLVTPLRDLPGISDLRGLALSHNSQSLTDVLEKHPLSVNENDPKAAAALAASGIIQYVFTKETSAVLQRMAKAGELPIENKRLLEGIACFLANQPDFNIRTTSIYNVLKHPDAFNGIEEGQREEVTTHLKTLQRVQAISSGPDTVAHLLSAGFQSAQQVAELPEKDFVQAMAGKVGEDEALFVHHKASDAKIKNEQALICISELIKGTGVAAIDHNETPQQREVMLEIIADKMAISIKWENLLRYIDVCECGHCTSVYSQAPHFVELLQYLRNSKKPF